MVTHGEEIATEESFVAHRFQEEEAFCKQQGNTDERPGRGLGKT